MKVHKSIIEFESNSQIDFVDITEMIQEVVDISGVREGTTLVYARHTTMGIAINHNEAMLLQDFMNMLYRMAPVDANYAHDLFELRREMRTDGRSNGHSHCKALLTGVSETIPIEKGKLMLKETQAVFAVDFDGARKRDAIVQVMGL